MIKKNFPIVNHYKQQYKPENGARDGVRQTLKYLTHVDDNSIVRSLFVSATFNGLQISGHTPSGDTDRFSATIQVVDEEEEELHDFGLLDDSSPAQLIIPG